VAARTIRQANNIQEDVEIDGEPRVVEWGILTGKKLQTVGSNLPTLSPRWETQSVRFLNIFKIFYV